jgi:hypothetical protein
VLLKPYLRNSSTHFHIIKVYQTIGKNDERLAHENRSHGPSLKMQTLK